MNYVNLKKKIIKTFNDCEIEYHIFKNENHKVKLKKDNINIILTLNEETHKTTKFIKIDMIDIFPKKGKKESASFELNTEEYSDIRSVFSDYTVKHSKKQQMKILNLL